MLVGEDDPDGERRSPWEAAAKPDPRIEAARKELTAYVNALQGRG
jgi:hypothetical protein